MNREIKFRVWNKQTKAWAKNDCSFHCFSNWQIDPFTGQLTDFVGAIDGDRETRYNANPAPDYYLRDGEIVNEPRYVLIQFTGLKDKNGKEIYEGDIIHYKFDGASYPKEAQDELLTCEYNASFGGYTFDCKEDSYYWAEIQGYVEIVGNVFENPELLEK